MKMKITLNICTNPNLKTITFLPICVGRGGSMIIVGDSISQSSKRIGILRLVHDSAPFGLSFSASQQKAFEDKIVDAGLGFINQFDELVYKSDEL